MIPDFAPDEDFLIPGIHEATWQEFVDKFGYTEQRMELIKGLRIASLDLRNCGCGTIYVDGSFITTKMVPKDIDVCWDKAGVDFRRLCIEHPIFLDDSPGRQKQKAKYGCEFFPAHVIEGSTGKPFLDFFLHDRNGNDKGILKINIQKV